MPFRDRSKKMRHLIEAGYGDHAFDVVGPWLWEARFNNDHANTRELFNVLLKHGIDCKLEAVDDIHNVIEHTHVIAMHEEWLAEFMTGLECNGWMLDQLLTRWPLEELEAVWRLSGRAGMARYWFELGAASVTVAQQASDRWKVHT